MNDIKAITAGLIADGVIVLGVAEREPKQPSSESFRMSMYRYRRIVCPYTGTATTEMIDEKPDYSIEGIRARLGRLNQKAMSTAPMGPS